MSFVKNIQTFWSLQKTGLIVVFFLFSCVHTPQTQVEKDFSAPYEDTWKALVSIMKPYPIKVMNIEKGYIETKALKGSQYWRPPHKLNSDSSGLSAVLKVYVTYQKPHTKVSIQKVNYSKKDFFSPPQKISSSQLEEQMLLYRLKRELYIQSRLNK